MPELQEMFKEAWSHALAGVNAAEQEAEKVLARIADAAGFSPEDVRRHAREFGERLTVQRREIERTLDDGGPPRHEPVPRAPARGPRGGREASRGDLAAPRGARQGEEHP